MKEIKCVIMDWAGTAVDYGCFAPLKAFLKVFKEEKGIEITLRQAREPMGMLKIDHIRAILSMDDVRNKFSTRYNREWNETDVDEMYRSFEKHLFASLSEFTTPIPGVIETIESLRQQGIAIGSTTGYTAAMMEIVRPGAAAKGYTVDNLVTPDNLPAGRPAPYMIYNNIRIWQFDSTLFLFIGILLIVFSLWTPVRFYIPKVVIAKYIAKIAKQESSSDDSRKCLISEIVVGILIGIILMIIEQNIDLTFIK